MFRFVLKRAILTPPAILIAHFFGFTYAYTASPAAQMAAEGMIASVLNAYKLYMAGVLRGDLGLLPNGIPLAEALGRAGKASLGLFALAMTLSILFGLLVGFQAAKTNPSRIARWMSPVTTFGLAMPSFYLGSLAIVGYIYYAIWSGPDRNLIEIPVQGFGWDLHLFFPVLVLMGRPVVQIAQMTAELLVEEYDKEYVVAGRAYGQSWRSIRLRFALRNSLVSILANVVSSYRLLLGELILVEYLFAWPGMGRLMASALVPPNLVGVGAQPGLLYMDPYLIAALIAIFATLFLLGDLAAAILSRMVDPRLRRLEEQRSYI